MFSEIPRGNATVRWLSGMSANFVPLRHFLILEGALYYRGLSQVNKVEGALL
jgi:hypothetical protein